MAKQILCLGCRGWFDGKRSDCPDCGRVRPGFNKWLRTAALNNGLFKQAERAEAQKRR